MLSQHDNDGTCTPESLDACDDTFYWYRAELRMKDKGLLYGS